MTVKHATPGPWRTHFVIDPRHLADIGPMTLVRRADRPDDRWVALACIDGGSNGIRTSNEERDANARLIAAAPDLLAALKGLCGLAEMRPGHLGEYKAAIAEARAVISAAEQG